ncbi:hypothetical protein Tco_0191498 [Tanacetum coccineum]
MASMNTRLNIEKIDENIVQKHGGSKQVGFKQLGPGVEQESMKYMMKNVFGLRWNCRELKGIVKLRFFSKRNIRLGGRSRRSGLSEVLWAEDTTMSTYLVNRSASLAIGFKTPVVLYKNMGFNESGEYKKTFIGSGVGTGSMQVLQGDEFEVKPQDGHTFEVEPHGNVDHVVGSQEYREDSNEAAFAVAAVEKIYSHESLTFNNTVASEVISKWKARLKDDMDARSDVYVLNSNGYYLESTPGQTLLKGHSILSLEGSLSGDCDVEKNGKWSCIYAVGSQEYQMVCTRLDIASADVGILDKFDRGLQIDVQVFMDFDYAMAAYMTLIGAWKKEIWLKGLLTESGYELSLVAGIATGALVKGSSRSEVPAQVEGATYRY